MDPRPLPVSPSAVSNDWAKHGDFASLLTTLMAARNIQSDQQLADRATALQKRRDETYVKVERRSVNNWKRGASPPDPSKKIHVELIRQALRVPDDASDPLAIAWKSRLDDIWNKKPVASSQITFWENGRQRIWFAFRFSSAFLGKLQLRRLLTRLGKLNWHQWAMSLAALCIMATAFTYVTQERIAPVVVTPPPQPPVTGPAPRSPRPSLPYAQMRIGADGFVFPDSHQRLIPLEELHERNGWDLYLARNEIFARRGHRFQAPCLISHFDKYRRSPTGNGWYQPEQVIEVKDLTEFEHKNVSAIRTIEGIRSNSYSCATH